MEARLKSRKSIGKNVQDSVVRSLVPTRSRELNAIISKVELLNLAGFDMFCSSSKEMLVSYSVFFRTSSSRHK